ncbi:MAG: MBL fold metallo-hydrolase [Deltaproteobacteria bacterium]|nr:MBL fold metallo-hydrolase [Deltaproteobacteria bacterium]
MTKLLKISILCTIIILSILSCASRQSPYDKKQLKVIQQSENFRDGEFVNIEKTRIMVDWGLFKAVWKRVFEGNDAEPDKKFILRRNKIKRVLNFDDKEFQVAWLGHSTVLIKIEGKYFMTDPVWGKRASPLTWAGPKRFFNMVTELDDLPKISGVIISHDHYDHLDEYTIRKLAKRNIPFYYVPLGVGKYLVKWGVPESKIKEFDWWDQVVIENRYKIISTPSKHFSGRALTKRNQTLWSSWVIKTDKYSIYFSGDGGYSKEFKLIGDKYGPFDIAMLESGAYDKLWPDTHLGPKNVLKAYKDLRGKVLMPIHWGLFQLGTHPWKEPAEKIIQYARENEVNLLLPKPGVVVDMRKTSNISYWWRMDQNKSKIAYSDKK